MRKRVLPISAMGKIIKKCGGERVSERAKQLFREYLLEKAEIIAAESVKLAHHAGRKTVKASDVKLAKRHLKP